MSVDDIPLLRWQPPAKMVLFPLDKRVGKVRHTARLLMGKHGEDADLYWKQVTAANRKHLKRVGLASEDIEQELRAFFDAVQAEIVRQSYSFRNGGGAA